MTKTKSNKQNGCEETEKQRKHQGGCEAAVVSVVEPNATSKTDKATKAVMMKLIVPELQMHFPSYVIGSIALVSSSLSNSGNLFWRWSENENIINRFSTSLTAYILCFIFCQPFQKL